MSERIIFLDIDGPMIPAHQFIFHSNASYEQVLCPKCVMVLAACIRHTRAKIVFNTTHNTMLDAHEFGPGLRARFAQHGFDKLVDIHEDDHTIYPQVDRLTAINEWVARNGGDDVSWVAFDDCRIDDQRAYLTDADHGIGWHEWQHARQHLLGEKPRAVLL